MASETCAFDLLDAEYVRRVELGELIVISDQGLDSHHPFPKKDPAMCVFEYVYFARPDSRIFVANAVYATRKALGRSWPKSHGCRRMSSFPFRIPACRRRLGMPKEQGFSLKPV
ncbi:MAG: hypothetical protein QM706_19620 [Nitrospira sp.]